MKEKRIKTGNTILTVEDLINNNVPFVMETTTFTKKVQCDLGFFSYCAKTDIQKKELPFITEVRNYCETLEKYPRVDKTKINYIRRSVFKNVIYKKDLYEIDLSQAYWNEAYKRKYISKEIYQKGLKLSKQIRLIALGALAKTVMFIQFDGSEYLPAIKYPPSKAASIFFKVSQVTDNNLKLAYLTAGRGALFYWCDAIFLRGKKNFEAVKLFFKENGLPFKYYEIDKIQFKKDVALVYSEDYKQKKKDKKEFRPFNFNNK